MSSSTKIIGLLGFTLVAMIGINPSVSSAAFVGDIISVNIDESQGRLSMSASDLAGANADVRVGNWNNIEGDAGTITRDGTTLVNQSGSLVGGSIEIAVTNPRNNALASNSTTNDQRLYSGYSEMWQNNGGQVVTVDISGIQFAQYDVYVYWGGGNSSRGGSLTLDGTTFYARGTAAVDNLGNGYAEITNTNYDPGNISGTVPSTQGNYSVATGLTGSDFSFSLQALNMGNANWRHRFYGFQIVEIPEPSSLVLLAAGMTLCLRRDRGSVKMKSV